VHEDVFATVITDDKAEALLTVEELNDAGAFADDLRGHTVAAAEAAATTAAAEAATAATAAVTTAAAAAVAATTAATAEAVTAAEAATITKAAAAAVAAAATKFIAAEAITLVAATSAAIPTAPSIETHALFVFPVRPKSQLKAKRRTKNAGLPAQKLAP